MSAVPSGAWAPRSQACCVETRFIDGRAASRSASTGGERATEKETPMFVGASLAATLLRQKWLLRHS